MRHRAGLAVVDVAIAIAVAAVLLAAIVHGSGAIDSARTSRVIDDVQQLREAVQTWVRAQGRTSYDGVSVAALNTANVLTKNTILTPWGGTIELSPRSRDSYWVTITGAPEFARDALARRYEHQALQVTWNGMTLWMAFE